ncbi:hypothetical protein PPSIR1_04653 [Plesiocystis pacifica SIR-1]|uniref:Uncharacterized protein n=1 Tax=Plesiocystis pacifica SIR-1 TaxID=391625 RepID=A6FWQ3_9BACT|nr:hypothetical protein PPSIR1_04653 [Plesiocystis pacifica SIR-1]
MGELAGAGVAFGAALGSDTLGTLDGLDAGAVDARPLGR